MFERLEQIEARFEELSRQMAEPEVLADHEKYQKIAKQHRDLEPVVSYETHVSFDGPVDTRLSAELLEHLVFTLREGLTNIEKHAHAARVAVTVDVSASHCTLVVRDDGVGIDNSQTGTGGLGLVNMRRRAEKVGGTLDIESSDHGTTLTWRAPLSETG